jgi:ketol-acid reductoisomerase
VNKRIGLIGWGSQAQAWAHNLADSNYQVTAYLRRSSAAWKQAPIHPGIRFEPLDSPELQSEKTIALLIPDDQHAKALAELAPQLSSETMVILAHGFSFEAHPIKFLYPSLCFALLAPKAIASELRERYKAKSPLAAAWALDRSVESTHREQLLSVAEDLGITYLVASSFAEEAKADLFSEQTLLCSLLPYGAKASYDRLVKGGVNPELAFLECWMELKLIADAMVKMGPVEFFQLISPNALIGAHKALPKLLNRDFYEGLEELYRDIESGQFYSECQKVSVDEQRLQVLDEWKNSSLFETYTRLKHLLQKD